MKLFKKAEGGGEDSDEGVKDQVGERETLTRAAQAHRAHVELRKLVLVLPHDVIVFIRNYSPEKEIDRD